MEAPVKLTLQKRPCPSCGSETVTATPRSSNPPGESFSLEELKPYWNGHLKKRVFLTYARCPQCEMIFCPNFFSESQLKTLYDAMPDNTAGVPTDVIKRTQRGYFDVLKKFSPLKGEFLEVGPDLGFFTECCVQQGSYDRLWLFEPKTEVQESLKKIVQGKNATIVPAMLDIDRLPDRKISTAIMIHVLDHLLEPRPMLEALRKKLTDSGILLIVTHDESSLLTRVLGSKWGGYSLEHPQLFSPTTIKGLLQRAGYKVLAIEKSANVFPVSYLLRNLLTTVGFEKVRLPELNSLTVRLKLGNIVTIATPQTS